MNLSRNGGYINVIYRCNFLHQLVVLLAVKRVNTISMASRDAWRTSTNHHYLLLQAARKNNRWISSTRWINTVALSPSSGRITSPRTCGFYVRMNVGKGSGPCTMYNTCKPPSVTCPHYVTMCATLWDVGCGTQRTGRTLRLMARVIVYRTHAPLLSHTNYFHIC